MLGVRSEQRTYVRVLGEYFRSLRPNGLKLVVMGFEESISDFRVAVWFGAEMECNVFQV